MRKIILTVVLLALPLVCFAESLEDHPYFKAIDLAMHGKFEEAKIEFEKALASDPNNITIKNDLEIIQDVITGRIKKETASSLFMGIGVAEVGGYYGAIDEFTKAINSNPEYAIAYISRGNAYDAEGKFDEALSDFNKALELNPRDVRALNGRAIVYESKKLYDKAISDYNKAIEIEPKIPNIYYNKAGACRKAGRIQESIEAYKRFIQYAPPKYTSQIESAKRRIGEMEKDLLR